MVTMDDIRAGADRIAPHVVRTPLLSSPRLDAAVGGRLLLKAECLQTTGSFKLRGAANAIAQLPCGTPGVVAYSSGNHAQAVAYAARAAGLPAVIVMPADAPRTKRERTAHWGAEIVAYDRAAQSREAIGEAIAAERGYALVLPFDHPHTIAGQGTAGLEAAEQCAAMGAAPDQALICCSGGGLAAGMGTAIRDAFPDCAVFTVEPERHDDMARSLTAGAPVANDAPPPSVCDALMAPRPGARTLPILMGLGARGVTVTDAEAMAGVALAAQELRVVCEPGGAVALAAAMAGRVPTAGRVTLAVLSGGNADADTLRGALNGLVNPFA